eukprot:277953_1
MDIADYDIARKDEFLDVANIFIEAARDYLSMIESDHMATVLLEIKSDIENKSAMDMALEFQLKKFISDNRVERITTSIMNDFEFLRPTNQKEAFEIDPISVKLIWRKIFYPQFYFTPLGTYCTTVFLYFAYLMLFTYLSINQFRVYDPMSPSEIIFWIFNMGYVAYETQMLYILTPSRYYSESQNYFDTIISLVFITDITIRIYALYTGPPCEGNAFDGDIEMENIPCWNANTVNTLFSIFWSIATIVLWLRIINFCVLSHSLGPMVQMIFRMMSDIITFFEIMVILYLAFVFALFSLLRTVNPDFEDPTTTAITLFRAILGDFDFGNFNQSEYTNPGVYYFGYFVMLLYLVIGALVFLNLLIAMMAKTFDSIEEDTIGAIIFA